MRVSAHQPRRKARCDETLRSAANKGTRPIQVRGHSDSTNAGAAIKRAVTEASRKSRQPWAEEVDGGRTGRWDLSGGMLFQETSGNHQALELARPCVQLPRLGMGPQACDRMFLPGIEPFLLWREAKVHAV
jgi:hypothetical protein